MGTLAGVGISHHRHPVRAAQAAVEQALNAAQITQPTFVFLFATLGYDMEKLVATVRSATGYCPLAGCSGQGVIVQQEADESNFAVSVMVIRSDEISFTNYAETRGDRAFEAVGEALGMQIQPHVGSDAHALFLFTDGLSLNFDRFAQGLQSQLQLTQPLPIFGGAAGSNIEMRTTYQFCDDQVLQDGTVATLMRGAAQIAWGANHGCVPIGTAYTITRAQDNLIYELDGQPVFEVLRQYLTDEEIAHWDGTIVSFCFGLKIPGREEFTIRYLPQKDEANGSVMLQTEATNGTKVWVMRRDQSAIEQGTEALATQIQAQLQGHRPKFVLQFDCYGRGKSVFTEQQKHRLLQKLQHPIGEDLPWIGFYSHGEIAPIGEQNAFHNYTLVMCAVY